MLLRSRARGRRALVVPALLCTLGFAATARAADTQWWITDSPADYAKAELRGTVVDPDGAIRLGPRAEVSSAETLSVIWSLALLPDGSVAVGGDRGRIDRWTERGGLKPWVKLPVGQVLALAVDGDGLVAGTGPEGLVYRVSAKGDTTRIARTRERYVWGLAPAGKGQWFAATGTRGRLLRLPVGDSARIVLDTEESNLSSMTPDGHGGVYVGGDSKGLVIHVRPDGSARTLFDASEDEVRALTVGRDGALYAAALSTAAVAMEAGEEANEPAPARSAVTGGRAVIYRIQPDSNVVSWWSSPQPFVFALAASGDGVAAATGNRAGVYRVERAASASLLLAPSQGQVTALAADRNGRLFAATSNPAALWRLGPGPTDRGEITSSVLDARRIARFGRVRWQGDAAGARVEFQTRSGNTESPDTTWSAWGGGSAGAEGLRSEAPPARYFQWRMKLAGGTPRIDAVETAWREQNLPPRFEEIVVAPQGQGFREGDLTPRPNPITQTLKSGQKVEYSVNPSANPQTLRMLPAWARGLRTVQWKAGDPNGDPLSYKVDVRSDQSGEWTEVGDDLESTSYTWDTNGLPDGRYRLRVIASDVRGNAVGEERTAEITSEPFTVDNEPPAIESFSARGEAGAIVVNAEAADSASPFGRIEVSVDDGDWRPVSPDGGVLDHRQASVRCRIGDVKPGSRTVSLRVVDLAGNSATRATRVTVPAGR